MPYNRATNVFVDDCGTILGDPFSRPPPEVEDVLLEERALNFLSLLRKCFRYFPRGNSGQRWKMIP